jgi:hypothetical protein
MVMMPDSVLSSPARLRPAAVAGVVAAGVVATATIVLWAYYGTAVFFETIAAGIAACF